MNIKYILTTFSPSMFGEKATAHFRIITAEDAYHMTDVHTRVVATRPSHERLARAQFPDVSAETARYAMLTPGVNAIFLHYRGPQVPDSGEMPIGGMITFFLIETEEYAES